MQLRSQLADRAGVGGDMTTLSLQGAPGPSPLPALGAQTANLWHIVFKEVLREDHFQLIQAPPHTTKQSYNPTLGLGEGFLSEISFAVLEDQ